MAPSSPPPVPDALKENFAIQAVVQGGKVNAWQQEEVKLTEKKLGFYDGVRKLDQSEQAQENRRKRREEIRQSIVAAGGRVRTKDGKQTVETIKILERTSFIGAVSGIACLNAIVVGLDTDFGCEAGWNDCTMDERMPWYMVENVFTTIFFIEMGFRLSCGPLEYFRGDPIKNPIGFSISHLGDFIIVVLRVIDSWILQPTGGSSMIKLFSVLRVLHIVELVRRAQGMASFKEVWMILHGVWNASRVVFWTCVVLFLVLYITAIVMTHTVIKSGEADMFDYGKSAWELKPWTAHDYWGSVPQSLLSLFQIVTLDHWCSTLVRPLVRKDPKFMLFFFPFMAITVVSLLNVIVAVIVESTLASAAVNEEKVKREEYKMHQKVMDSLKMVFEEADEDGGGDLDRDELKRAYKQSHVRDRLKVLGLEYTDLKLLFDLLDEQKTGAIPTETFFRGCTRLRGLATASDLHHMSIDFGRYINWAQEMADTYSDMNDRLAGLLGDIEGLDRDIVKGKHDDEDPILMARRSRFQRHTYDPLLDRKQWTDDESLGEESECYDLNEGHSVGSREVSHHGDHHGGRRRQSLVGITLRKTDLGMDLNEVREFHGHEPLSSIRDEYEEDLEVFGAAHEKPQNPWDVGSGPNLSGLKARKKG